MKRGIRGCFTLIGAAVVLIVAIIVIVSIAGSHSNSGKTSSPALDTNSSATSSGSPAAPEAKTQTFKGTGTENIGTIHLAVQSTLHWSCPSCSQDNFIVNAANSDLNQIDVNGLNQTHGVTVVDAGTYKDVTVDTEGAHWVLRFVPGT